MRLEHPEPIWVCCQTWPSQARCRDCHEPAAGKCQKCNGVFCEKCHTHEACVRVQVVYHLYSKCTKKLATPAGSRFCFNIDCKQAGAKTMACKCLQVTYCSVACQKADWDMHRFECALNVRRV